MQESQPGRRVGYVELLRGNRHFRRLKIGRLISQTGDWVDSVALLALVSDLTGWGGPVRWGRRRHGDGPPHLNTRLNHRRIYELRTPGLFRGDTRPAAAKARA